MYYVKLPCNENLRNEKDVVFFRGAYFVIGILHCQVKVILFNYEFDLVFIIVDH